MNFYGRMQNNQCKYMYAFIFIIPLVSSLSRMDIILPLEEELDEGRPLSFFSCSSLIFLARVIISEMLLRGTFGWHNLPTFSTGQESSVLFCYANHVVSGYISFQSPHSEIKAAGMEYLYPHFRWCYQYSDISFTRINRLKRSCMLHNISDLFSLRLSPQAKMVSGDSLPQSSQSFVSFSHGGLEKVMFKNLPPFARTVRVHVEGHSILRA